MKRHLVTTVVMVLFPVILQAQEHRHADAHEHGIVQLDIAIEDKTADIDLEAPAFNIYGFEHRPVSAADKAKQNAGLEKIRKNLTNLIQFQPDAGCSIRVGKLAWVLETAQGHNQGTQQGEHSVVQGEFKVTCKKSLPGTKLRLGFSRMFREFNLNKVRVQAVTADRQTSKDILNDEGEVQL
ncbi:MAG: DUF2796 domain-containing protein [Leptospirales bacterium]|nr:DUF2796 domain-containing protein [Leptospirales bacterium]